MIRLYYFLRAVLIPTFAIAQEQLPSDNTTTSYHSSPRYRESESHPLRVLGYIFHPVGWVLREGIFRPLNYLISSTETSRSVLGYREPFDYRQPECFSANDSVPSCRATSPYNYSSAVKQEAAAPTASKSEGLSMSGGRQFFFPDVAFDFNKRTLSPLGRGRTHQIAALLKSESGLKIVLEGHADNVGPEKYNEKLGMDRADAVLKELTALGVGSDRISTVTFGESKPLFSEEEDWARAVNRRVEVHPADAGKGALSSEAADWTVAE